MDVKNVVFAAINEINQMLPPEKKVPKSLDTELLGASAAFDSLGLVNFIVEVEQRIQETFNLNINLADQRSVAENQAPLKTIGALVEYINYLLEKNHGGK